MRRIFSAFAYGSEPLKTCFWAETVPNTALSCPPAAGDTTTDVAVIGAGFTGLSAALHLAEDVVEVTVLEAQFPGWGASGRNGGFCCLGGAKATGAMLVRRYGQAAKDALMQAETASVALVGDLLQRHGIDADTHSNGETVLAHSARAMATLRADCAEIESDFGVTPQLTEARDLPAQGLAGPFHGALTIPIGFGLNPRKYLAGLLAAARSAGADVYSQSPVTGITAHGDGYLLTTPTARIRCKRLIVATNGYSSEDLPQWLGARYMPAQSNVLVTRPLTPQELAAAGWTSRQMAYDSRNLLHYFRLMPDNRFLFGRRGGLMSSPRAEAAAARATRNHFEAMFPAWKQVESPHNWSGMVCLSAGLVPFCGAIPEMPNAYAALAYHGNGVAMGSYCGALLADLVQGRPARHIHPDILKTPPRRFPLGRFRRALMPPVYAAARLGDIRR